MEEKRCHKCKKANRAIACYGIGQRLGYGGLSQV